MKFRLVVDGPRHMCRRSDEVWQAPLSCSSLVDFNLNTRRATVCETYMCLMDYGRMGRVEACCGEQDLITATEMLYTHLIKELRRETRTSRDTG